MTVFTLADYLVPVIITMLMIVVAIIVWIGYPYLKHIFLVSKATDDQGEIDLAKHLAHKTGGKEIHVDETWEEFRPAAKILHRVHIEKKDSLQNK